MGIIGILTCEILKKDFAYLFTCDRDIRRISVIEDAKSNELIKLLLVQKRMTISNLCLRRIAVNSMENNF